MTEKRDLPVIPRLPKGFPTYPNAPIAKCGECGREVYAVEGYCCMRDRCPITPKVTC